MPMIMEQSFVNVMAESASNSDLNNAVTATIIRITRLDHFEWMEQLACDGFTEEDIKRMDVLVPGLFQVTEMETQLAATLAGLQDLQDEEAMNSAIQGLLGQIDLAEICQQVCNSEFPDPIDALASVARYMINIAGSTLAFETLRRSPRPEDDQDWRIESSEVTEGVALAEEGLEGETAEWPVY